MRPSYTSCFEHFHAQADKERAEAASNATPRFLCLNELPRLPSPSPTRSPSMRPRGNTSPFLRLPPEIRLQIYSLLVLPQKATYLLPSWDRLHKSTPDYFDYDAKSPADASTPSLANLKNPVLMIRTLDPVHFLDHYAAPADPPRRTVYSVRCDRFRSACRRTTYHCVNNPRLESNLAILRANKQIHAEAAELLYTSYTFDFDTHIEAIVAFLSDLTPWARSCIKSIRLTKRALAYEKEFDRCEWQHALRYLSSALSLRRLHLGVVAGRPGPHGWDRIPRYSAEYFRQMRLDGWMGEGMEWLQYLLEIRGLEHLGVRAVVEHCPPVTSSGAMARYVRFSASVEGGFGEFLRGEMVGVGA